MSRKKPAVAWLEDDDRLREEICKKADRELRQAKIHFSATIGGFWQCLRDYQPQILIIDVMLPPIKGVRLLSEGVGLAGWVRRGLIPQPQAAFLKLAAENAALPDEHPGYADTPIVFLTGRTEERLGEELKDACIRKCRIIEKRVLDVSDALDDVLSIIRDTLNIPAPG
ncbi:hypothetical protein HQ560_07380 [bacterium]|nr:hypothetical protein [bacterium]